MSTLQIMLPDFADMDTGEIMLCNRQRTAPGILPSVILPLDSFNKKIHLLTYSRLL